MAYRRYKLKRPRYSASRKSYRRYKRRTKNLVRRVRRVERITKTAIESKFVDHLATSAAIVDAWTILYPSEAGGRQWFNSMIQNPGNSERIGRKVAMSSFQMKAYIKHPYTAVDGDIPNCIRVLLVMDRFPNGVDVNTLVATDVMLAAAYGVQNAFPNVLNKKRFKILRDWCWPMNGHVARKVIEYYKRFKTPKVINFAGATQSSTDLLTNGLFMMIGCDINGTVDAAAFVTTRMRYYDA